MKFTVNAYKHLLGLDDTYRLQRNGDWTIQRDFTLLNEAKDWTFNTFEDAQSWLNSTGTVIINGEETSTFEKEGVNLFSSDYFFEIVTHRFSKPTNPIITKEQLKNVLEKGNDNYHNSLVIDYDGTPKLIQITNRTPASKIGFPARYETFHAGNGYVGHSDFNHLDTIYMIILEAWASHLISGRSIYRDYASGDRTEQELIDKIISEVNKLK